MLSVRGIPSYLGYFGRETSQVKVMVSQRLLSNTPLVCLCSNQALY